VAVVVVAAVTVHVAAVAVVAANVVAVLGIAALAAVVAFLVPKGTPGGCFQRGFGETVLQLAQPAWESVISENRPRSVFQGIAAANFGETSV
jgi:hypothetical protein